MKDGYFCKECGMAVIVLEGGNILRPCGHTGTIIAGMSGTAYSVGNVHEEDAITAALNKPLTPEEQMSFWNRMKEWINTFPCSQEQKDALIQEVESKMEVSDAALSCNSEN